MASPRSTSDNRHSRKFAPSVRVSQELGERICRPYGALDFSQPTPELTLGLGSAARVAGWRGVRCVSRTDDQPTSAKNGQMWGTRRNMIAREVSSGGRPALRPGE